VELSTDQKGTIAEMAIALAAAKLCLPVYAPVSQGTRYDLIIEVRNRLLRVQCKWAVRQGDVVMIRCRTCRRSRSGLVHRSYTTDEIDLIAGYCAELDQCYVVPFADYFRRGAIHLRLAPTKNNQQQGILSARDFEFERLHWAGPGAIAQLGERQRGTLEVAGSSPAGSTFEAV
jgi:PD-(D/E)XK endonuclease